MRFDAFFGAFTKVANGHTSPNSSDVLQPPNLSVGKPASPLSSDVWACVGRAGKRPAFLQGLARSTERGKHGRPL